MQKDPRSRNTFFNHSEIKRYLREYTGAISHGLNRVEDDQLEKAYSIIRQTAQKGGRIFVGGNGGSAAISDHLCCDFVKGTATDKYRSLDVHSMNGSMALGTAIANDFGYQFLFSFQLTQANVTSQDCVILISSSGDSKNIRQAIEVCMTHRVPIIGLTGFAGGALRVSADSKLHVQANNYGVVEDCHQAIMHILAQFYYLKLRDD